MADQSQASNAEQAAAAPVAGDEPLVDVEATANRLTEIASESLDTNEVARQIEELTSVVLDSAEVSTRSASIAADVSATMRAVVTKIQETNRRNVMHSRIVLGVVAGALLLAIGVFFAITVKMTKSIKELDTIVYSMAKRVIEVDASLTAIGKTNSDLSEVTDRQDKLSEAQEKLATHLDEMAKTLASLPASVIEQSNKAGDPKAQALEKELQSLQAKLTAMDSKLSNSPALKAAAPSGPTPQVLLLEIQRLRQDLETISRARNTAQSEADKSSAKVLEMALSKSQAAADKAEKAANLAGSAADRASAAERAAAAERQAALKAAAEKAVALRSGASVEKPDPDRLAQERAAAQKAAALKEKAAADKAAADKAAADKAAADRAAAEKAAADRVAERAAEQARQAAAQAANAARSKENLIKYPRASANEEK